MSSDIKDWQGHKGGRVEGQVHFQLEGKPVFREFLRLYITPLTKTPDLILDPY